MKELDDFKKLKFGYLTHSETLACRATRWGKNLANASFSIDFPETTVKENFVINCESPLQPPPFLT